MLKRILGAIGSLLLSVPCLALDSIIVFNELQYHSAGDVDGTLEFVELHNQNATNVDLSGWRITGEVNFTFPSGTVLDGNGYLVIAANPSALEAESGRSDFMGPYEGALDNGGGSVRLRNHNNRLMDELDYDDRRPWPIGPDGSGVTLSKKSPQTTSGPSKNWASSGVVGGTPGEANFPSPQPSELLINEIAGSLADSFWVELYHGGETSIDLSGYVLSFESAGQFSFPAGSTIGADSRLLVTAAELSLETPPVDGEKLFLYNNGSLVLEDAARIDDLAKGRSPDGAGDFQTIGGTSQETPGDPNLIEVNDAIVINEIMYHHRPRYAQDGDPPIQTLTEAIGWNTTWRFNRAGSDEGANWSASAHPVAGDWEEGTGPLGHEPGSPIVPLVTEFPNPAFLSPRVTTYYFETDFEVSADGFSEITELQLNYMVDDGAIFYLNGVEIFPRHKMPNGPVTYETLASASGEANAIFTVSDVVDALVQGTNRLSVEIHQKTRGSSDIVMGLQLQLVTEMPGENPPVSYLENDEEWIELYNRSSDSVDLGNWEFRGAVDYDFPIGTVLGAGEYLVVAKDPDTFGGNHSGVTAIGGFSGTLSNNGEHIRLVDQFNNLVDGVSYLDGQPWPSAGDGGGSSIELKNPETDNANPAAWSASNNHDSSDWQTYEYTLVAKTPLYAPRTLNFHELRLGLLDSGVFLIDDFSIIEDPDGTNLELLENGSFNNADGWRLLGTHQNSGIVSDGGESVLRVEASARSNYVNNLIEANLTSNGTLHPVQNEMSYRISFRAKWLSGSPQLRFELYYNKIAQVVILDQPSAHGTPGVRNSTFETNPGPDLTELKHSPPIPAPGEEITVSVNTSDPDGLSTLLLHYSVDGGTFQSKSMQATGDEWTATIPGQSDNSLIQFYVEATDSASASSFAPPLGPDSRALIKVAPAADHGIKRVIRINMLPEEAAAMHEPNHILDNLRTRCTIILDDDVIAYDSGVRLRGSMWSRRNRNTGLNLKLPADRAYRGLNKAITVSRKARSEIQMKHLINVAGGIHDSYNDVAQLDGYISEQVGRVRLEMTRFGNNYLSGLPGGEGREGTVFKMEGVREFQQTVSGINSPKRPHPVGWVSHFDLADQGEKKEDYRHNTRINSGIARDDYSGVIDMLQLFSLSGAELEEAAPQVIDLDRWIRQFALLSLCGVDDTYTRGNAHNLNFYVRADGFVDPMPWDWDHDFNLPSNAPLWGGRNFSKLFLRPVFTRMFYGHIHDLISTSFNTTYLTPWFTHLGSCSNENYTGNLSKVTARVNYVLSQLPANVPFTIGSNGGSDFTVDTSSVSLTGNGWVNVRQIRVNDSPQPITPKWTGADSWQIIIPLSPGENMLNLTAIDYQGNNLTSDSIMVTNNTTTLPAAAGNLVVTEIMYNPLGGTPHEYLELMNIHPTAAVDLTGVTFVSGIEFSFPDGMTLAPGERILIVNNLADFTTEYGPGHRVAGIFEGMTKLSNGGEIIAYTDATGADIQRFTYNDASPWPAAADGEGRSLVLKSPFSNPEISTSWRASVETGGTPGSNDGLSFDGLEDSDVDGDGFDALLEYALASDPLLKGSLPRITLSPGAEHVDLTLDVQLNADDVVITPQLSTDLDRWTLYSGTMISAEEQSSGVERRTYRFVVPADSRNAYGRVLVVRP